MIVDKNGNDYFPRKSFTPKRYGEDLVAKMYRETVERFFAGPSRVEELRVSCGLPAFDPERCNDKVVFRKPFHTVEEE